MSNKSKPELPSKTFDARFIETIDKAIKAIEDDERMKAPSASVQINAPLALIQCNMEGRISALRMTREFYINLKRDMAGG